nr:MAG TPA: hypothetical protein [Caudoviricetes sp.]
MRDETKQKLGNVKEFMREHKSQIEYVAYIAGCYLLGNRIGHGIANGMESMYHKGFDQGMNCCYNLMINENTKNPEVLKALVDFNIKHCENHH